MNRPIFGQHQCLEMATRYRADGSWLDLTLSDLLESEHDSDPQRVIAIDDYRVMTVADLRDNALRLARWFAGNGIQPGDVVSFILPNWSEALVIDAATCLVGAVTNPIVPIYRDAEVRFILQESRSKILFIPSTFRNFDYGHMLDRIHPSLPDLRTIVAVKGEGALTYQDVLAAAEPITARPTLSPNVPRLLMFTSGTTGRAKGVLHSYNTLNCEVINSSSIWRIKRGDIIFMASPVTHITGYIYAICQPLMLGVTAVLMERWDAAEAVNLIERHGANATVAATPFLKELAAAAEEAGSRLPSLRIFACGGAPVPPEVIKDTTEAFDNCAVFRVYGSTEAPTVTLGAVDDEEVAAETEGYIVGHEVKIVDETGQPVVPGHDGEILTRGPEMMLGYLREEDNASAYDSEGYFMTGDIGHIRADGALVVTGRKKDLIVRGGENLSAKEIEDVLHQHPKIREAAIVAMPHKRLGETVCAFIILKPDTTLQLSDVTSFLEAHGLARQKFPEHIELVDSLPRTASGKIQKFVLRDRIRLLSGK